MKRYIILIVAVILSATSCTTFRYASNMSQMQSEWEGRTHADIVRTFGAPSREVSDGAGGQILVYENFYTTHSTDEFMGDFTTTSREHRDFKEFYIDPEGTCYQVRTNEAFLRGRKFGPLGTAFLAATALILILALSH
ncbi:MAG: hypothetical protein IK119_05150 [Bacteroidales bacterium]|nr:hypothetical protein [Bacteroidales bacterium]